MASFLSNYRELGWGYLFMCITMMAVYSILFLIHGLGFIFLWVLLIKGIDWVATRPKLAFATLLFGLISCAVGLYFSFNDLKNMDFPVSVLFLIPVVIGCVNFTLLAKKYEESSKVKEFHTTRPNLSL